MGNENGKIYSANIGKDGSLNEIKQITKDNTTHYEISNNQIYYREVGMVKKHLTRIDLNGNNINLIIEDMYVTEMVLHNNYVYFYNSFTTGPNLFKGDLRLYKFSLDDNKVEKI